MDRGNQTLGELQRICPVCGRTVEYTLVQNRKKAEGKPCRSCANSISRGGDGNVFPSSGLRVCSKCRVAKPLDDFMWVEQKQSYYSQCDGCRKASQRVYHHNFNRFKKLGIDFSKDQYDQMLSEQDGRCKICEQIMDGPCVDHCHTTKKVRGLLCRGCNTAIGSLGDDPERIRRAASYLRGEL